MSVIEILMGLMLDLAAAALIFNFVYSGRKKGFQDRVMSFCMGIGFVLYCFLKAFCSGNYIVFMLSLLGAMLSHIRLLYLLFKG